MPETAVIRRHIFPSLTKTMLGRISSGRTEAAKVWMWCRDLHATARKDKTAWPRRDDLQRGSKNRFALHSQTVQMVCHAFLANIDTTADLRRQGQHQMKYPWRDKRYFPLLWPKQAVAIQGANIILPMGRGRPSIVLPKPEGFVAGGCKLIWNGSANELHVTVDVAIAPLVDAGAVATVDLGQIHQCAVTTDTGQALIVSGRGQRSLKRRMNKMHGEIARLQSRCKKGSRRYKHLGRARHKHAGKSAPVKARKQHGVSPCRGKP
jgi:putative transposase